MIQNFRFDSIDDQIEHVLLENRRILLSSAIDARVAEDVIRRLWYLELGAPGKPITIVINSPGGSTDAGFAIWDQIQMLTSPLTTLVTGVAASMGSILSLAAATGRRFATPHTRIMIHQPAIHGDLQGDAADLAIHAKEILNTRAKIVSIYVEATGKDEATIQKAIDRDTWMSAQQAADYGLVDKIVSSYQDLG